MFIIYKHMSQNLETICGLCVPKSKAPLLYTVVCGCVCEQLGATQFVYGGDIEFAVACRPLFAGQSLCQIILYPNSIP
jgi:hypothetical protein